MIIILTIQNGTIIECVQGDLGDPDLGLLRTIDITLETPRVTDLYLTTIDEDAEAYTDRIIAEHVATKEV